MNLHSPAVSPLPVSYGGWRHQMSNQIQKLINRYLSDNNISRSEFAKQLRYINASKGLKRLDEFLITLKSPNPEFQSLILQNTDISAIELQSAIEATQLALDDEERKAFKPSLRVIPNGRPTPIFAAGILNIEIPDGLNDLSVEKQILAVTKVFRAYQNKIGNRKSWAYAKGFRYFRSFDETLEFDSDCKLLKSPNVS